MSWHLPLDNESAARSPSARSARSNKQAQRQATRRRQLADLHVLRYVPGTSSLHRCWAGTKIVSLAALSIVIVLRPTWESVGIVAAVLLAGFLVAALPRGIAPRVPRWIFLLLAIGACLALVSGGAPYLHLGHARVGMGGLAQWVRFSLIGLEVLVLAALISWTTPLADLAPALGRLGAPLRLVRVPVDEFVGAIALAIRCLPLLLEEMRVMTAARRTRRPEPLRTFKERAEALEEVLFASLSSALRRARELAEAIEARGGSFTAIPETHPFGRVDAVALAVSGAAVVAMALLG